MTGLKILCAAMVLAAMIAAPIAAQAADMPSAGTIIAITTIALHIPWFSYIHNYGPGPVPGTWAYYDGPTSVRCKQSAAAYRGQDGRRYPCN